MAGLYNDFLATALQDLATHGIPTIQVDAFGTLQAMVNSPIQFGFANVTVPLLELLSGETSLNPAEFVFWDSVIRRQEVTRVLEGEALNSLADYFSPRKGRGTPDARINALKGLTHAGQPYP